MLVNAFVVERFKRCYVDIVYLWTHCWYYFGIDDTDVIKISHWCNCEESIKNLIVRITFLCMFRLIQSICIIILKEATLKRRDISKANDASN